MRKKIKIDSNSKFVPEISNINDSLYYFSYEISIQNKSGKKVKLLSRHWNIINGFGDNKQIDGEGVIGKKPIINPGEVFKYSSYCPLSTQYGTMNGFYTMKDESGEIFKVIIPKFSLYQPEVVN